jgi:NAD(P)H-flavin reductase
VAQFVCDDRPIAAAEGASLLEALLAAGVPVAHSCRAGICQSCLVKATRGTPPPEAQVGLRPSLVEQGFFLACVAKSIDGLEISTDAAAGLSVPATITAVTTLGLNVVQVLVEPDEPFEYRAGQYVTLVRDDGLARSYSIASLPGSGPLEFHVRVLPHGRMSTWLATAPIGSRVELRGPAGECYYSPGQLDQPLILAGTGTGLAPLWGILRDALKHGHRGAIRLLHGARVGAGLYHVEQLEQLAAAHPNVDYSACVLEPDSSKALQGSLDTVLLDRVRSFAGHGVFLCGDPDLVLRMKRQIFLGGARLQDIRADAFVVAPAGS